MPGAIAPAGRHQETNPHSVDDTKDVKLLSVVLRLLPAFDRKTSDTSTHLPCDIVAPASA